MVAEVRVIGKYRAGRSALVVTAHGSGAVYEVNATHIVAAYGGTPRFFQPKGGQKLGTDAARVDICPGPGLVDQGPGEIIVGIVGGGICPEEGVAPVDRATGSEGHVASQGTAAGCGGGESGGEETLGAE